MIDKLSTKSQIINIYQNDKKSLNYSATETLTVISDKIQIKSFKTKSLSMRKAFVAFVKLLLFICYFIVVEVFAFSSWRMCLQGHRIVYEWWQTTRNEMTVQHDSNNQLMITFSMEFHFNTSLMFLLYDLQRSLTKDLITDVNDYLTMSCREHIYFVSVRAISFHSIHWALAWSNPKQNGLELDSGRQTATGIQLFFKKKKIGGTNLCALLVCTNEVADAFSNE